MIIFEENKPEMKAKPKYPCLLHLIETGAIGLFTDDTRYVLIVPGKDKHSGDIGREYILTSDIAPSKEWRPYRWNITLTNSHM